MQSSSMLPTSIRSDASPQDLLVYSRMQCAEGPFVWPSARNVLVERRGHIVAFPRSNGDVHARSRPVRIRANVEVGLGICAR